MWLTIPFSVLVGWVFSAMEGVGQASENLPGPIAPVNDILM